MKFAVSALFGIAAATQREVWSLRSVNEHRTDSGVQKAYGDHSVKQANGRNPYDSTLISLQTQGDDFFQPWESGKEFNGDYKRVITNRFSADSDDIFMRSMIKTYALESKDCDEDADGKKINCKPSGKFFLNKSGARAAAAEVLGTHKGLKGDALSTYLNTYFDKAWSHFDVNRVGTIEVIKAPQLMRFLASDQSLQLGESGF